MAISCHPSSPAQTTATGYILAKTAKSGIFYFFTGVFSTVNTEAGDLLVGGTGLFPATKRGVRKIADRDDWVMRHGS